MRTWREKLTDLTPLVGLLDAAGLRRPMAMAASALRPGQAFAVDADGHWVNAGTEATFVSPSPHFAPYGAVERAARHLWTWAHAPGAGETVIDVGAGIGEETAIFSRLVGENGRVVAIEAHPETFACLTKTVRRSALRNVTAVFAALADCDGMAAISSGPDHLANATVGVGEGARVPARSLDSLAEELGLGRVDLLKMNIEGAEKLAVRGMSRLAPHVAHLCISCHDFRADRGDGEAFRSKAEVRGALERMGFAIETRSDDPAPWVRDYLYARQAGA